MRTISAVRVQGPGRGPHEECAVLVSARKAQDLMALISALQIHGIRWVLVGVQF